LSLEGLDDSLYFGNNNAFRDAGEWMHDVGSATCHRCSQGDQRAHSPQVLEHIVILCFERRFSKQNSVIRLKTNILPSPKFPSLPPNYWVGYATAPCPFTRGKGDGGAFKSIIGNFRICQDRTETNLLQLFVHQKVHNGFL